MNEFIEKFRMMLKPAAGKAVAFVVGAAASAMGMALSPETLEGVAEFVSRLFE